MGGWGGGCCKSLKTCRNAKKRNRNFVEKKVAKMFFLGGGWKSLKTCRNAKKNIFEFFQNGSTFMHLQNPRGVGREGGKQSTESAEGVRPERRW